MTCDPPSFLRYLYVGTFDMTLLLVTVAWLAVNLGLTVWLKPALFDHPEFWMLQVHTLSLSLP